MQNYTIPPQTRRARKDAYITVRNALPWIEGSDQRQNAILFTSQEVRPHEKMAYFLHSTKRLAFRAWLMTVDDMWNDVVLRRATAAVERTHPLSEISVALHPNIVSTPYGNAHRAMMDEESQAKFKARDEAIVAKIAELKSKPRRMMPSMLIARSSTFAADLIVAVDAAEIGTKEVEEFIKRYRMLGEPLTYGAIYVEDGVEETVEAE